MTAKTKAILLVNLGTPLAPDSHHVGLYLNEFLMDPMVLRMPWLLRAFLVKCLIVPRRKQKAALLYQRIWTREGSPLLVHSKELSVALEAKFQERQVVLAMRYGEPSIGQGLKAFQDQGVTEISVVPLYPHYALSTYETCVRAVHCNLKRLSYSPELRWLKPFFNEAHYLHSLVSSIKELMADFKPDHLLFSYHGLPESHVRATDPGRRHCFATEACCESFMKDSPHCYKAQCLKTTKSAAAMLGLNPEGYSVAFQSRLGRVPWLRPYTEDVIKALARKGVKRLCVVCPSFTADCLETLEEINLRAKELFINAGGRELRLVPALNSRADWVEGLSLLIRQLDSEEQQVNE